MSYCRFHSFVTGRLLHLTSLLSSYREMSEVTMEAKLAMAQRQAAEFYAMINEVPNDGEPSADSGDDDIPPVPSDDSPAASNAATAGSTTPSTPVADEASLADDTAAPASESAAALKQ